jgi:N-acetylglucosaminyldiphosphoundecaprenol N-acetyl-beta-D-mannosaminyltransferase
MSFDVSKCLPAMPRVQVAGVNVTVSSFSEALDFVGMLVERRVPAYISCANAYSISLAHQDDRYREILNSSAFVTSDGIPVVWALHLLGYRSERVHNDDLMLACCASFPNWRHYLVGGRRGQPQHVSEALELRFPGINIVGAHPTPVRPVPALETESILDAIRSAKPDIVWVGMGTPSQDEWMFEAAPRSCAPMVACGSCFDLLSGRTKPAPEWMKRHGLQWAFRLVQEPGHLAFRYFYHNPRFVAAFALQFARVKLRG